MKKQNVYIISGIILTAGLAVVYAFLFFALPVVLNSDKMVSKYETFLSEKLNSPVKINNFNFKTNPNLSFEISTEEISSKNILKA